MQNPPSIEHSRNGAEAVRATELQDVPAGEHVELALEMGRELLGMRARRDGITLAPRRPRSPPCRSSKAAKMGLPRHVRAPGARAAHAAPHRCRRGVRPRAR